MTDNNAYPDEAAQLVHILDVVDHRFCSEGDHFWPVTRIPDQLARIGDHLRSEPDLTHCFS